MARTKHVNPDGSPRFRNRLAQETSPYLLQHAHNPVEWFPWGNEAFEEARKRGVPILLSIGYSTCHWCHVMEEESFEDLEVAQVMNDNYVCIKVDREERPDVDSIYMTAVQAISGHGGWPMTVWLNHEREPFFAGTYFPARDGDRGAGTGFITLLQQIRGIWDRNPEKVQQTTRELTQFISESLTHRAQSSVIRPDLLPFTVNSYRNRYDPIEGGLGGAPKFPSSLPIRLLLRAYHAYGEDAVLEMATHTLSKMAGGGLYDHVAGGFHRYSVDAEWLVPHFEKMLYDNAQLVVAYLEAYQITGRADFARVAREILRYIEREMTAPEGGFFSATDADSIGPRGKSEEGYFFTWTPAEIDHVLSESEALLVKKYYAVTEHGNFEERNIFHAPKPASDVAEELELSEDLFWKTLNGAREKLFLARKERPEPLRDEKVLAAWNGLMISAFAKAGFVLNENRYLQTAMKAARFVAEKMQINKKLQRTYKDGKAKIEAYLEDYANMTAANLDLFEATGDNQWLEQARDLDDHLAQNFEDANAGAFFRTSHSHEKLIAREKPLYDGAEPSGNSIAIMNLLRLHALTGEDAYRARADRSLAFFADILNSAPGAVSDLILAAQFRNSKVKQIVIVPGANGTDEFLSELRTNFHPHHILIVVGEKTKPLAVTAGKVALNGRTTAYVCENGHCELPAAEINDFRARLNG